MGTLFLIFALAMASATFIENDFGSQVAYSSVYNTRWFEFILLILAANLIGQLIIYKMFRREKLPMALFHLAFILMITGAGITRYFGWEGTIHIREGEMSNICYSGKEYISYSVTDAKQKVITEDSNPFTLNASADFKKNIRIGDKEYKLILARIIQNAEESVTDDPNGKPLLSLLITKDMMSRENVILREGDIIEAQEITIGFNTFKDSDVRITVDSSGNFVLTSKHEAGQTSMMTGETVTAAPGSALALKAMQIITVKDVKIVPRKMTMTGSLKAVAVNTEETNTGKNALIFHVISGNESESITLLTNNAEPFVSGNCTIDGNEFKVSFGSRQNVLPFELHLNDFVLERYPGSNSPSGYRSNVTLSDDFENVEKSYSIYMNNILKYKGYRFYQSSFDRDEKGTILAINHDPAGLIVTYTGYALLFIFIILSLINRNSLFRNIKADSWSSPLRKLLAAMFFIILLSVPFNAQSQSFVPGKDASAEFGKVLVQDQKGRTKPLFTLSSDILRKVSRENRFGEYTPVQVFLGLYFDFNSWQDLPIIRVSNNDLQKQLGLRSNMAAFTDLVNMQGSGSYKLSGIVNTAYEKSPGERSKFDKEVMKVDERVNIIYMIYKGDFMKIFPLKDGTTNWGSAGEALKNAVNSEDSAYLENIVPLLSQALQVNNPVQARQICESITGYQNRFGGYSLPSETKVKAELLYYKMGIFEKLFPFYATTGILMLTVLISVVILGRKKKSLIIRILSWLLFTGFLFHTFGLGLRWYIAGHSPMSNGYESMLFISWVTILAGFIFSRKSEFALSATAVLGGMTLMVAHLSFMDPEITNLVPVLKSYWLTLHVSVITGSYGFLGLGAILGIIIMILLTLVNEKNRERISETIDELVIINFRTLTLGLCFLTIGTFLGAVWANESWGRYWGWDPKETWSLITIIVYTLVTHSRMIPAMKNIFAFNILSLFAFSSVLMTYFGVNYYLSGLHSYASGDPVPVPVFVYITVIVLIGLCVAAYLKYRRYSLK
jgi:cytochrome c-type biogenesis protein CcsB